MWRRRVLAAGVVALVLAASAGVSHASSSCDEHSGHCICMHGTSCVGPKCTQIEPANATTTHEALVSGFSKHLCPECKCENIARWHTPSESETVCRAHPHYCTPGGWAWLDPDYPIIDTEHACAHLDAAGIHSIAFLGDSFMRHAFEAFIMILTGNYDSGALTEDARTSHHECFGEAQFEEKNCRQFVQFTFHNLCGGRVQVAQLHYGAWTELNNGYAGYDVILWSGGAHPVNGDENRFGIHNAQAVANFYFDRACRNPHYKASFLPSPASPTKPRVFWILQHQRLFLTSKWGDETEELVQRYNQEASKLIKDMCNIPSIDTYSFTHQLVHMLPEEAEKLTWDKVHWARSVNLVKVQLILHTITQKQ